MWRILLPSAARRYAAAKAHQRRSTAASRRSQTVSTTEIRALRAVDTILWRASLRKDGRWLLSRLNR
jgi:hypothetical protein